MKNKYKRNFLDLYKSVKNIFVKPKFTFYIGPWRSEPNLPVWRRGPMLYFGKYNEVEDEYHYAKLKSSKWNEIGKKNHPFLSKIIKHPTIQFPYWLSFYLFNNDLMYKTKWEPDDFRYEFPPHITLVLFGFAISITAHSPVIDGKYHDDDYWESILLYKYYNGDLKKANIAAGKWQPINGKEYWAFNVNFLKKEQDKNILIKCQEKLLKN